MKYYRPNIKKKVNKLTVTSVERKSLPIARLGSGGAEEAVASSGDSGWRPGRGQGVGWGEVYPFRRDQEIASTGLGVGVGLSGCEARALEGGREWVSPTLGPRRLVRGVPFWERVHCSRSILG